MTGQRVITNGKPRRSMSLIEQGDTYIFNGLKGGTDDKVDTGNDRLITVFGISVGGDIHYTIQMIGADREPSLHSCSYLLASQLIEEQIWQDASLVSGE